MTKEQFLKKWYIPSQFYKADLDAVIAHEIERAKVQPALNPIAEAYERGEKISGKNWSKDEWIKKHSESQAITNLGDILDTINLKNTLEYFTANPEKWELYTEPADQVTDQVQNAKPFDKDRFEAMFRAVVASGRTERWEQDFKFTEEAIAKLDAYYASKEGGGNNE